MEGEIGDKSVDENLDFDDCESHPDTGLHGYGMRRAPNNGMNDTAYPGSNGKRHQV